MLVFLGASALCLPLAAQDTAPDRALLAQAQQAMAAGQWTTAATTLESFRTRYPTSPALADGLTLLYQAYLAQQLPDKAAPVGKEIVAKWPKSNAVWQVVLITCKQKAKTSPADAIASLELALQQHMLSATDRPKAQHLRLTLLDKSKSAQFLPDALATINDLQPPIAQADLLATVELARGLYPKLMAAGRFDDAKGIMRKLEEFLVTAGNPQGAVQSNQKAYLEALKTADPQRFLEEALPAIRMIALADTPAEARVSVELLAPLYLDLFRLKPYDEIKALHETASHTLTRLEHLEMKKYEECAWLDALRSSKPDLYVTVMQEKVAAMKAATSADEVIFRMRTGTIDVYLASFNSRKPDEAQAMHTQIQDFFTRFTLTEEARADRAQYTCARLRYLRETAKTQYLADVLPVLGTLVKEATCLDEVMPVLSTVVYYGPYQDLLQVGRVEDAATLSAQVQAALTRLAPTGQASLTLNAKAYLGACSRYDPEGFLALYAPRVAKLQQGGSAEEVTFLAELAQTAYGPLYEVNHLERVQQLHAQLQTALARFPALAPVAEKELKSYLTLLGDVAPAQFLAELQPVLTRLAAAQTLDDARACVPLVQLAYAPLNRSGSFLVGRTAHEQVQALYAKLQRTPEAEADRKKYQESLSVQALEGMLQLFKHAMTAKETATAERWLKEMNAVAPESFQAARARAIWKEAAAK